MSKKSLVVVTTTRLTLTYGLSFMLNAPRNSTAMSYATLMLYIGEGPCVCFYLALFLRNCNGNAWEW